jgi:uncharacterized repeat protein (TIGR02543 family)
MKKSDKQGMCPKKRINHGIPRRTYGSRFGTKIFFSVKLRVLRGYILPHLLLILSLFLAACPDTVNPPPPKKQPLPAGYGSFTPIIAHNTTRTILPAAPALFDFTRFELTFTPMGDEGGALTIEQPYADSDVLEPVPLIAGTYNLTVSAYKASGNIAARGTLDNIVIAAAADKSGTVILQALFDEGGGTFTWDITLDASPITVSAAAMTIKDADGAVQKPLIDLLETPGGSCPLPSGLYTVVFTIDGMQGEDSPRTLVWNELLYIYAELESEFSITFTARHFTNTHWNVTFNYNYTGGGSLTESVMHGDTVGEPSVPHRTGYVFIGWNTQPDGSGTLFTADTAVTEHITVYAQWMWKIDMIYVPGGSFEMGKDLGIAAIGDETPVHTVTLTGFYMSKYLVTQEQYQAVMGTNPSYYTNNPADGEVQGNRPVENVSWYDAIEFCNALSIKEGLSPYYSIDKVNKDPNNINYDDEYKWTVTRNSTANGYRLPTEAQWEYAAKGGNSTPGNYTYAGSNTADDVAWHSDNSDGKTHEVGKKAANGLGLYDMNGNVYEWCWDWWFSYSGEAQTDPVGAVSGSSREIRGGSCINSEVHCRSVFRHDYSPYARHLALGFRLVRPLEEEINKIKKIEMVSIPGGSFEMGDVKNEGYDDEEKPVHTVTLTGFYMSKYQVTQAQYQAVMGTNPSYFTNDPASGEIQGNRPVEGVSWYDAIEFCNALSIQEGLSPYYTIDKVNKDPNNMDEYDDMKWTVTHNSAANGYRLPTEAQWEYAAKGGNGSPGNYTYAGSDTVGDVAWYWDNSDIKTHEVGKKAANGLGLYDMSGNVNEWCWDWYGSYWGETQTDPVGAVSGSYRVARGDYWGDSVWHCRSASRTGCRPSYGGGGNGFRLVRP